MQLYVKFLKKKKKKKGFQKQSVINLDSIYILN
jgi:hypothetical protein